MLATVLVAFWSLGRRERSPDGGPMSQSAVSPEPAVVPEGAEALSLLGRPLHPLGLPEPGSGAEAGLAEARARVEEDPGDAGALLALGRGLATLGRYREAQEVLARGAAVEPRDPRFPLDRGRVLILLRRLEEGTVELKRAAELVSPMPPRAGDATDSEDPGPAIGADPLPPSTTRFAVWYHLGLGHYLLGELEQAALALNEALGVADAPEARLAATFWHVSVFLHLGLDRRAERSLAELTAPEGTAGTPWLDLLLLFKGERTAEDLLGGPEATTSPPSPVVGYGLGLWHFTEGRRERGFELWERVVAMERWDSYGLLAAEAELARAHAR